jgi:hypothetical protein
MLINGALPEPTRSSKVTSDNKAGSFPGPTISADWGDYIIVNVHNDMQDNG